MTKKKTEKKVVEKAAEPKAKKVITYRHWNGESYENRTREE